MSSQQLTENSDALAMGILNLDLIAHVHIIILHVLETRSI